MRLILVFTMGFLMLLVFSNLSKKTAQIIIISDISFPSVPQLFGLIQNQRSILTIPWGCGVAPYLISNHKL
ncbi:hypothetical protein DN752_14875 [Echinicola strongylocentroti]|uniref:Uncharacterized protein n=1 Tax=Echinicola strongylocentroti TaxID=1795355 RepID=A0A2Z4IL58_9BACT|nr:hypothetical protein DN752_14875 [Echinicola strongylocentroti]